MTPLARFWRGRRAFLLEGFLVFNLELNEGLESSYSTLRDEDPFDAICDHLLVENKDTGEVVGTYQQSDAPLK